jgi:putative DNA primase/helicase
MTKITPAPQAAGAGAARRMIQKATTMNAADLIKALGGDPNTGLACCPAHNDTNPSLSITEVNGKVLFHCHGCRSQSAVLNALRDRGLWPIGSSTAPTTAPPRRSNDDRRKYALQILADTAANQGHDKAELLSDYFAARGIKTVPPTAMLALPWDMDPYDHPPRLIPDDPGMIFAVTDGTQIIGCHVTWLIFEAGKIVSKRRKEPQCQFFGPVSGGYIRLYEDDTVPDKFVIAEGVETATAFAQLRDIPTAIAALSAGNMPKINPPRASGYIIAADNDENGTGYKAARRLAYKLVRAKQRVWIKMPEQVGTDWNDELVKRRTPRKRRGDAEVVL